MNSTPAKSPVVINAAYPLYAIPMTPHRHRDLRTQLASREGHYGDSLRKAARALNPHTRRLYRENATILSEGAALAAAELGLASLIDRSNRREEILTKEVA